MEIHILKDGRLEGPFSEEDVLRLVGEGQYSREDLAQTPQSYYWTPLHKLLEGPPAAPGDSPLPDYSSTSAFATLAVDVLRAGHRLFSNCPLEAGLLCLVLACLGALLSTLPLLMYIPWVVGSLTGAAILIFRGRVGTGLVLCALAIILPLSLLLLIR